MICSGQKILDRYLKVLGKVVDEAVVRSLYSAFQRSIKVDFKNPCVVIVLQITKFFFLFTKKSLFIMPFLIILHKSAVLTVTFTKHIYFKLLVKQLTTNN